MAKATTRALILSAAIGTISAPSAAQPSSLQRTPPASGPETRRFDGVLGILGDKAILESSISSELKAYVDGARNAGKRVTPDQEELWRFEILRNRLDAEALAQGARTMRGATREQVDRLVDQKVKEFVREEEEKAGSINQLTQELGFLGQTLDSIEEDRRTRLMGDIAYQQHLARRYQDSWALAVTPAQMREYYRANIAQFVSEASTDLEIVAVPGSADGEGPRARAQKLAEAWRARAGPAEAIAAEFGAVALDPRYRVTDTEDDPHAAAIKEFAARAAQDQVSDPIRSGSSFWVLRATRVHAARHDKFSDPKVQAFIQRELASDLLDKDRQKLIAAQRAKVRFVRTGKRAR